VEQITDKELSRRWQQSLQKIKDMCNPLKDPHYCPTVFHPDDVIKIGKSYLVMFNLSLNADEIRPRVLERPSRPKPGNPNLMLKKSPIRLPRGLQKGLVKRGEID